MHLRNEPVLLAGGKFSNFHVSYFKTSIEVKKRPKVSELFSFPSLSHTEQDGGEGAWHLIYHMQGPVVQNRIKLTQD